jgi:hypothetical protein
LAWLWPFSPCLNVVWYYHHDRLRALLWAAVVFFVAGLAIYLTVVLLGYYLNPATVSVLAVILRVFDLAIEPARA